MSSDRHPMAPEHLPRYFATADGGDYLMTVMIIFTIIVVLGIGVGYFTLHALPERMAHKSNTTQLQLISILAILALFTHNNIFWVGALILAAFRPPDLVTPLNSIATSLQRMTSRPEPSDSEKEG